MRLLLSLFFSCCLAYPLSAQEIPIRDSTHVLWLLKEGQALAGNEKTKIISAQYFGDAFRLSDSLGFYKGQGEALRALGMLDVRDSHKYSVIAMDYFKKSLAVWEEFQDVYEIANTFIILGDIFSDKWNAPKEALAYFKQALTIVDKLGRDSEKYHLLLKIFKLHINLDEIEDATKYSVPLLKYYEKQKFHEAIAQVKLDIAQYWAAQKEFEKAKKMAKEAQSSFQEHGGDPQKFEPYMNSLMHNQNHVHTISTSRLTLMGFTVFVLLMFFVGSYIYARRQVAKLT